MNAGPAQRRERTDQHVLTVHSIHQTAAEVRDDVKVYGWTAHCSCGWKSRVFSESEDRAQRAADKHSDWVEKPFQKRHVNVQITLRGGESLDIDELLNLIKAAEKANR